ncbi:MAG: hypothetical protein KF784_01240 [Fimbriimonadaceae bacterium]|nr:hypothetical protein [Fimbriimonadaceae bacterium]
MHRFFSRLIILAALIAPILAGCETLEDKPIDQGKADRIQNEVENSNGDQYHQ